MLNNIITKYLSRKRGRLFVAFIDFRKAFDYVDRRKLLLYLHSKGLRGNLFYMLSSLFDSLQSCVRVNNNLSGMFPCLRGLQQGSPLSPLLFNLFIDSISDEMCSLTSYGIQLDDTTLTHLLYADDLVLFSYWIPGLQKLLDGLSRFSKSVSF
ncbi:MAG: reverse transcriptase domain-containing protein [Alphaproteobacteria bacterium]